MDVLVVLLLTGNLAVMSTGTYLLYRLFAKVQKIEQQQVIMRGSQLETLLLDGPKEGHNRLSITVGAKRVLEIAKE